MVDILVQVCYNKGTKVEGNETKPPTKGEKKMKKFEIGKTYMSRCFGDHELVEKWTIEKITAKTITAKSDIGEVKTVKIREIDGCECARVSYGFSYIRADKSEVE